MKNFRKLYEAGAVKRWHTKLTIKDQDLAAHSWGVAMIVAQITPPVILNTNLIMAALTHDLAESVTGDLPYPVKKRSRELRYALEMMEDIFEEANDAKFFLTAEQKDILKWADMFELYMWCLREAGLGNTGVWKTIGVARKALEEMGFPSEAAQQLYEEVTNEH